MLPTVTAVPETVACLFLPTDTMAIDQGGPGGMGPALVVGTDDTEVCCFAGPMASWV